MVTPESGKITKKSMEDGFNQTISRFNVEESLGFPKKKQDKTVPQETMENRTISPRIQDEQKENRNPSIQTNEVKIEITELPDKIEDEIESKLNPETTKLKTEQEKPVTTTFTPLPSKSSIEQKIDTQTFSSRPSLNNQKGQNFTYRLKAAEVEPFNDIMLLTRTTSPSEALRGIFEMVLRNYEDVIREEAAWNIKIDKMINDSEIKDINTIYDMEDETFRKQRLERMGLFIPPQRTRGDGTGKAIGCTIGQELVELVELLMIALDVKKAAPAYQWIMNVFVADYADILAQKAKKIKQAKYPFSREL